MKEEKGLTAKQDAFCRAVVATGNQTEAYLAAYNGKNRKIAGEEASKLMATPKIAQRVKELQDQVAAKVTTKVAITEALITERLLALAEQCADAKNADAYSPAVSVTAYRLLGVDIGMFTEKKIIEHSRLKNLSPEKKKEALDVLEAELERRRQISRKAKPEKPLH